MQRQLRLTSSRLFSKVQKEGRGLSNELLVLKACPNGLAWSRSGFSVAKKVGSAVVRNKVKRRLRAIIQHSHVIPGWDLVFIVRPKAAGADYWELKRAVEDLLRRARLARPEVGQGEERR